MQRVTHWKGGVTINKRIIQLGKKTIASLFDKKVLIGIGIGLIVGSSSIFFSEYSAELSKSSIEKNAKNYGMHYEDECKVFFSKDVE